MDTNLKKLQFHLTNRCNLKCNFCWKSHENNQSLEDLKGEKFLKLCKEACEIGPEEITISGGGEPTLRKDLFLEMAKLIKNEEIRGNLITNGTFLDEDLCDKLVEMGWDEVIVSIQGYDAEMDDIIRGTKGAFEKSLESINTLIDSRKKAEKKTPSIRFQVVLTEKNSQGLTGYLELANKVGVDIVNFRLVNERGDERSPEIDENFRKEIGKCEELAEKYSIDFRREFSFDLSKSSDDCNKPFEELVVFADGRVAPCCVYFDERDSKLLEEVGGKSLRDIWYGEKFEKFRDRFKSRKFPEKCRVCIGIEGKID